MPTEPQTEKQKSEDFIFTLYVCARLGIDSLTPTLSKLSGEKKRFFRYHNKQLKTLLAKVNAVQVPETGHVYLDFSVPEFEALAMVLPGIMNARHLLEGEAQAKDLAAALTNERLAPVIDACRAVMQWDAGLLNSPTIPTAQA